VKPGFKGLSRLVDSDSSSDNTVVRSYPTGPVLLLTHATIGSEGPSLYLRIYCCQAATALQLYAAGSIAPL